MKNNRHLFLFLIAFLIMFIFSGCLSQKGAQALLPDPEIEIRTVEIKSVSFEQIELTAAISLYNPAPVGLNLQQYSYAVKSADTNIVAGQHMEPTQLQADTKTLLEIPILFSIQEIRKLREQYESKNEIPYTLAIQMDFGIPVGSRSLKIRDSYSGSLPVPHWPEITVPEVTISEFGARTIDFDIVLKLKNPNSFDLTLGDVAYLFSVDEYPWAEGEVRRSYRIAAEDEQTIRIPLEFNYVQVGRATVNLLVGGKTLEYLIEGRASAGISWRGHDIGPFDFDFSTEDRATIVRPDTFGL